MSEHLRDVVISIPADHAASLEAWLVDHGFPTDHTEKSATGLVKLYAIENMSANGREQIASIGGTIVSQWKAGAPTKTIENS
jgi:hypothetical protein